MTWFIWRQHRWQTLWTLLLVALLYGGTVWVIARASLALDHLDARGCVSQAGSLYWDGSPARCGSLVEGFVKQYGFTIPVFELGVPLLMAIVGSFIGAPLVAREIEQRTQLVAWTQSVPRRRWYVAKVAAVGAVLAVAGLAAGYAVYQLQRPLSDGGVTASRWMWFYSGGLTPAGEALLAFALAVAVGAWLRRTLPAVGAALVGFLVLLLVTGRAVQILTPVKYTTGPRWSAPDDAWRWQADGDHAIPYHPAGQFWPLQLTFLAVLLLLAAGLLTLGWYATRTRAV